MCVLCYDHVHVHGKCAQRASTEETQHKTCTATQNNKIKKKTTMT